MGTWKTCCRA